MDLERVLDIIGEVHEDPNPRVRLTALMALAALDSDAARRKLAERVLYESAPEVREELRRHLGNRTLPFDEIVLDDGCLQSEAGRRLLEHALERDDKAWVTDALRILAGLRAETLARLLPGDERSVRVAKVVCDAVRGDRGEVHDLALAVLAALPPSLIEAAVRVKTGLPALAERCFDLMAASPDTANAAPARAALLKMLPGLQAARLHHGLWSKLLSTEDPDLRAFAEAYDRRHKLSSPWGIVSTWWSPLGPPLLRRAAATGLGCGAVLLATPFVIVLAVLVSSTGLSANTLAEALSVVMGGCLLGFPLLLVPGWIVQPVGRRVHPLRSLMVEMIAASPIVAVAGVLVLFSNLLAGLDRPGQAVWCVATIVGGVMGARLGAALAASVLTPARPVAGLTRLALFAGSFAGGMATGCAVLAFTAAARPTSGYMESDSVWTITLVLLPSFSAAYAWMEASGPWPLRRAWARGAAILLVLALVTSGWIFGLIAYKGSEALLESASGERQVQTSELDLEFLLAGHAWTDTLEPEGVKEWTVPEVPQSLCVRVQTTDRFTTHESTDPDLEVEVREGEEGSVWRGDDPPWTFGFVRQGKALIVRGGKHPLHDEFMLVSLPAIIQASTIGKPGRPHVPGIGGEDEAVHPITIRVFPAPADAAPERARNTEPHAACMREAVRLGLTQPGGRGP